MKHYAPHDAEFQKQTILPWFVYRVIGRERKWKLVILWKRLLAVFFSLAFVGYFSGITAFYFYAKDVKKYDFLTYKKALFVPFNISGFKREMGEFQIQSGLKFFEEKMYADAFILLRSGLAKAPDHSQGRIILAQFYLQQQYTFAIKLLEEALDQNLSNKDYLLLYFQILMAYHQDKMAIEQAERLLKIAGVGQKQLIAYFAAAAHVHRGNYDQAEGLIKQYRLMETMDGFFLASNILWERGNQQAAIDMLESQMERYQAKLQIYQRLTQYHLQMKNYDQARRYCILRSSMDTEAFGAGIDLLHVLSLNKEDERKEQELAKFLKQYGQNQDAMKLLSMYAIMDKNMTLADDLCVKAQTASGWDVGVFTINYIKTTIAAGNGELGIARGERVLKERPDWLEKMRGLLSSQLSVAYYAKNNKNASDVHLNEFLKNRNEQPTVLLGVAKSFEDVGALQQARRILLDAHGSNARNHQILSELIRIELAMGNATHLREYLEKLLEIRKPPRELLLKAYNELASDRFIFAKNRKQLLIDLSTLLNK